MKIFLDTADIKKIKELAPLGIIDGITTNPTHLAQEGKDPLKTIKELVKIVPDDISVEVTEKDAKKVYEQAKKIAQIAKNIIVKIPCHQDYYEIIKKLVNEKIKINVTLVFSLPQAFYMCKLGAKYISPFIGRIDDIDGDGIQLIHDIRHMIDQNEYETEIIAASIRSIKQFHDVILLGAHIATLPVNVFEKSLQHPLTDQGIEKFLEDWKKIGIKQFP